MLAHTHTHTPMPDHISAATFCVRKNFPGGLQPGGQRRQTEMPPTDHLVSTFEATIYLFLHLHLSLDIPAVALTRQCAQNTAQTHEEGKKRLLLRCKLAYQTPATYVPHAQVVTGRWYMRCTVTLVSNNDAGQRVARVHLYMGCPSGRLWSRNQKDQCTVSKPNLDQTSLDKLGK